ncbi:flagellar hook-length control protein FliK [Chitinimonas koreensis]|uniref:flagellar hook-length control protein FliK n=1 Tax=Chitinimonas koreensis TaxID=356302 RepID=UPI0004275528|nr:flagellar hook-length control protein FliK [Chitinimonas koreensis]QNM98289.1 flagellar hook-length control protein FliK [Chitinimonas koreensis]
MATTASTNSLLLNLSANTAKSASRASDGPDVAFEDTLGRQMQTQSQIQSQANARDAAARRESVAPREPAPTRQSEPARQPERTPDKARPAQETPGKDAAQAERQPSEAAAGEQAKAADEPDGKSAKPGQDEDAEQAAELAAAAQAGGSALIAQLQAFVNQALDAAQAKAEAAGDPTVQHAGLASALLDGKDMAEPAVEPKKLLLDGQSEAVGKLAAERQALPAELAAGAQDAKADFGQMLEQRMQVDAGTARQQITVPGLRVESPRSQAAEQSKAMFAVHHPVGAEGWDRAVGHKVVMMVSNQQQEVEMQLNPPNLGPLEVKLTLNQDQASLTFVAASAPVREALQASLPKLGEMLAESGIQLAQADVQSQGNQAGAQRDGQPGRDGRRERGDALGQVENGGAPPPGWRARVLSGAPGNVNLFI